MILAAYRDNLYDVVLFVHLLSFLAAFAPAVINPLLESHFRKNGGEPVLRNWATFTSGYTSRIALSALGLLLVTGIIMVVLADDAVISFADVWVSASFLVWIAIGGVVSAMILKGEKALAGGDTSGADLVRKGGAIATVLMLVMLYLMVFKPGSPLS